MAIKLRLTGKQYEAIQAHVIAPDGKEAGALLFCEPVFRKHNIIMLVKEIIPIPYESCSVRTPTRLSWPTEECLMPHYEHLEREGLSLIMLHSHPTGIEWFSEIDNENDLKVLPRLTSCIEGSQAHGSALMLPDGTIKGRVMGEDNKFISIDMITVADDDIRLFGDFYQDVVSPDYINKTRQVYGSATTNILQKLTVGLVGLSGTGAPLSELLLRYHIGQIVAVDFDKIDSGNLNRIPFARVKDAKNRTFKVDRFCEWAKETGLSTKVVPINGHVPSMETTQALSQCDLLFGCVDNVAARHSLNKIACAYLIPYFDLGVGIKSENKSGSLSHAIARCHYIQPDQSCLLDREAFSSERLSQECFRRDEPAFYEELKRLGYTNEPNDIQAVMTLTMAAATMAVDDLMARLHNYRLEQNKNFDEQERSFTHGYYEHYSHSTKNTALNLFIATGDKHTRF